MFDNLSEIFALLLVYQRLKNYISSARQFFTWDKTDVFHGWQIYSNYPHFQEPISQKCGTLN